MSAITEERLYNLLPAIYRIRDSELGRDEQLRALLAVIENELHLLEEDIEGLYDNWFVETADEWVLPYIGDLLGVRWLYDTFIEGANVANRRAYVANTLAYRRRKGTLAVLEQLAFDVTGWYARGLEFFQLLSTTQHMNHVRPSNYRTPDLRDTNALERLEGPFETAAHTADIRRMRQTRGKYNISNIGLFLWRLRNYQIEEGIARARDDPPNGRYTFDPLGFDIPLFNLPQLESEISHLAEEINVPDRLRPRALYDELEALRQALVDETEPVRNYFGADPPLRVQLSGETDSIPFEDMLVCDLSGWRDPPASLDYIKASNGTTVPMPIRLAIDPALGRLAFPSSALPGPDEEILVDYNYGFSGDLGGGAYDRRQPRQVGTSIVDTVADPEAYERLLRVPHDHSTLTDALAAWSADPPFRAVIQIEDNGTYVEDVAVTMAGSELVIQAANGKRPALIGNVSVSGGNQEQRLELNGLLIAGQLDVQDELGELDLVHCTLVPSLAVQASGSLVESDGPKVRVDPLSKRLRLKIERSIVGALNLPEQMVSLTVLDSIVDSGRSRTTPALVSGSLSSFPVLPASPELGLIIGSEGPYTISFGITPTTVAQARDALQEAIRGARDSRAYKGARVIGQHDRLVILPGIPAEVKVEPVGSDPTASDLHLDRTDPASGARLVIALVGGSLSNSFSLTSDAPSLSVRIGTVGPHTITLTPDPGHSYTFAGVRDDLHALIRGADGAGEFDDALVMGIENQLVIIPGVEGVVATFDTVPSDSTTLAELALERYRPAVAGGERNEQAGPPATFERTTVFGRTKVRELTLASESIFTGPIVAERLQIGCARFSYLLEGSRTPRRYRCQPDLALEGVTGAAEHGAIRARVTPTFTTSDYSNPGYAQLSTACPDEIRTGAEDGSEMGVFQHLRQPQREANLRYALEEYLRFGLEAGFFFVT